jgi:transposase
MNTPQPALFDVPGIPQPSKPQPLDPGPPGRACGECRHLERHQYANAYYHCALITRGEIRPHRASIKGDCKRRRRNGGRNGHHLRKLRRDR